jgi:hypothetical protein
MLSRVDCYKFTDFSEMFVFSIDHRPEDEGKKHLRNFGRLPLDRTVQLHRKQSSSESPP